MGEEGGANYYVDVIKGSEKVQVIVDARTGEAKLTPDASDGIEYRHISYDEGRDILYACDVKPNGGEGLRCFFTDQDLTFKGETKNIHASATTRTF